MQSTVVILGTGGTIAGAAADPADNIGYTAGQIGVAQLVAAVPMLAGQAIESEQVAQLDSKDMDHATWQRLARRLAHHLARPEVAGVVVTHGTDTLEETAYFLHRVLPAPKPVVLTAAMRPATALLADGPQNLLDAVVLARTPGARGVLVALAGTVHAAPDVRKVHTYRLDAFGSGDAGPLARIEEGRVRPLRPWPPLQPALAQALDDDPAAWPWVAVVANHAGQDARDVRALVAAGVRGLVVAGTGNATLSMPLLAALGEAAAAGVAIRRVSRCADGPVLDAHEAPAGAAMPALGGLSPWAARVELMLQLLEQGA